MDEITNIMRGVIGDRTMKTDDSGRVHIDPKVVQHDRELQIRNMLQTKQLTIEVIKKIAKEHS